MNSFICFRVELASPIEPSATTTTTTTSAESQPPATPTPATPAPAAASPSAASTPVATPAAPSGPTETVAAFPDWFEQLMRVLKTLHTLGNVSKSEDYWKMLVRKAWTESSKDSIRDRYFFYITIM